MPNAERRIRRPPAGKREKRGMMFYLCIRCRTGIRPQKCGRRIASLYDRAWTCQLRCVTMDNELRLTFGSDSVLRRSTHFGPWTFRHRRLRPFSPGNPAFWSKRRMRVGCDIWRTAPSSRMSRGSNTSSCFTTSGTLRHEGRVKCGRIIAYQLGLQLRHPLFASCHLRQQQPNNRPRLQSLPCDDFVSDLIQRHATDVADFEFLGKTSFTRSCCRGVNGYWRWADIEARRIGRKERDDSVSDLRYEELDQFAFWSVKGETSAHDGTHPF